MGAFDDLIPDDRSDNGGVLIENGKPTTPDIFGRYPALPREPKTTPAEESPPPPPANPFADLVPTAKASAPAPTPFDDLVPDEVPEKQEPGILGSLGKGALAGAKAIAESAKQTVELARGEQPQAPEALPADEQQLAAPFDFGTMPNAKTLPKVAYHFTQGLVGGVPELGAGLAAGAVTTAATGNPLLGLLGAAGGAGSMYVLRQIAPNFAAELKANPADPDKAWKLALEKTTIGGVTTAAGFAAFGLNPFEGELKNLAFQAFGVQPAVSMASKATENVVEGKPATKGLGSEYVESALGTVGPYAAMRPFHGKAPTDSGEAAGEQKAGPGPGEPTSSETPPASPPGGPAPDFAAPPPDFIANAVPASEAGEKLNTPQTFKIDPAAYGVETTGMEPAQAEQAANLATSTEESAAALRKALSDPAVVGPEIAREYEVPSFVKERSENESKAGVSAEPAQRGDQDRVEPAPAGSGAPAGGERGVGSAEGARLPPDNGAVVHKQPTAEAAGETAEAGAGAGRDASAAAAAEPARSGEPVEPAAQAAPNPQADLANLRRGISRATGQKGVRVYGYGEGAAYDPLGGYFTVGTDYPAHEEAITAAADLAKQPTPEGWRDTEVEATLDDGSTVKTPAGAAADAITARIKRAMSVMECLGA